MATRAPKVRQIAGEHGQFIYIYGHVRTRQIIYSLTRAIDNNAALRQLPYLGKKTVPRAIRKDFWRPLATVSFPSGHQGLHAFRELREYRIRHEHEWTFEELGVESRKEAGRKLRDQKANTIADLAAVLFRQEQLAKEWAKADSTEKTEQERVVREAEEELEKARIESRALWKKIQDLNKPKENSAELAAENEAALKKATLEHQRLKARKMLLKKHLSKPIPHLALRRIPDERNGQPPRPKRGPLKNRYQTEKPKVSMDGVRIEWADILDAEFAETWPKSVVHDNLAERTQSTRHSAPVPVVLSHLRSGASASKQPEKDIAALRIEDEAAKAKNLEDIQRRATTPAEKDQGLKRMDVESMTPLQKLVDRLKYGAR